MFPWQKEKSPVVSMFMSFPDSGSRYSLAAVEMATEYSTATFYGKEIVEMNGAAQVTEVATPVFKELNSGPFLTSDLMEPGKGKGLLTRTYCNGYCLSDCTCKEYNISPDDFMKACLTSVAPDNTVTHLDPSIFTKAIILIRNPFDNIIGRFHYEFRLSTSDGGNNEFFNGWGGKKFTKDGDGFRNWCAFVDNANKDEGQECFEDDTELLRLMGKVPCHSEFYKYVHWYNNAFVSTKDKFSTTMYHEDFFFRPDGQINELVNFLDLDKTGNTFEFNLRDYEYYYTPDEKRNILELINYMGSEDTLYNLRRYLLAPEN